MSVVTIQIGQCGNQVGYDWYNELTKELGPKTNGCFHKKSVYLNESLERWFNVGYYEKLFARAVLIDTEQKVVQEVCEKTAGSQVWEYNRSSVLCRKDGGSGNNWALGYCSRGCEMQDDISNCIRKEVENCDRLLTFNNILSCAGGTGSGLGSSVITHLRDEYPSKCIMNSLIFPYQGGEIITQNYNILLTLSKIYDISNIHVVFRNDNLHRMYYDLYVKSGNTFIGLHDLNSLISVKLLSFLQPLNNGPQNYLPSIISDLTPHPSYKMVCVNSAPHYPSADCMNNEHISWNALLRHVFCSLRASASREEVGWRSKISSASHSESLTKYVTCIANTLISRGEEIIDSSDMNDFHSSKLYPEWIPKSSRFYHLHQKEMLFGLNKFVALISNNSSMYSYINSVLEKAWAQFSQKAYLHQYTKYGLSEEEMMEAFMKIEDIVRCYRVLSSD